MSAAKIPPGLIVNADDLGIHPRINAGILSAYHNGIVTSATMLMTTAYLTETLDQIRAAPLPVGIHLSLTLGTAVADRSEIPDLVDERNNFTWSSRRLLLCSFAGKNERLLSQIRREFEAQLARARDYGLKPTHVDSHQHVHMNPTIFRLIEALLPRYGITRLRYSRETVSPRALVGLIKQRKYINLAKITLLRSLSARISPRLVTTDGFFGVLYSGVITKDALRTAIHDVTGGCSLEICVHPGFSVPTDAPYPYASESGFVRSTRRQMEHDILADPKIRELVRQRGLVLRGFDGQEKSR